MNSTSYNTASGGSWQNNIKVTFFGRTVYNVFNGIQDELIASAMVHLGSFSTNDAIGLWKCAFELVNKREAKLMEDYANHLEASYVKGLPVVPEKDFLSPHYVKFVVSQLISNQAKNKGNIPLPTTDTEMQKEIDKLENFSDWSHTLVSAVLESQPHTALAWSGPSIFLSLIANIPVDNKAMLEAFNRFNDMQIFWKICEEAYLSPPSSQFYHNLKAPLTELYSFIIEYQARVICHVSKSQISHPFKFMTGSDNWTEMVHPIKDIEQRCFKIITDGQKAEVHMNNKDRLQALQKLVNFQEEMIQDIKNNKQDDVERKLLGDLARASGDYARYKNMNPGRVPGTCEWFLADDRFRKWRDSQDGGLLWVSAGPGCGKSVLSKSLIDEGLLTPDSATSIESPFTKGPQNPTAVCYFFFKEGGEGQMDGAQALGALLHQLFQHPSTSKLISYALPSHRIYGKTLTQRMEVLWQILVECAQSSSANIVCVLDALDECVGESAHQLLRIVENSYSQHNRLLGPSKLKFFITSRPYDDLKGSFDRLLSIATYLHFDGYEKSGQISEEINLVIDVKVKHIAGAFSDDDRDKISERLKSMENRTYLWLHLILDIIEKKRSAYSRSADIEELLCELPSQVADAYEKILSRSQDERKVEALLQIVLAATRPLSLDEANNALALAMEREGFSTYASLEEKLWPQNTFKATVQNLCGLFISIHDSKLSFIHQTAREFLISQEQKGTWKGRLNLSKSHGILSGACINYLQIADVRPDSSDEYPLVDYSIYNWFLHFQYQDEASTNILRKPARQLCGISSLQSRFGNGGITTCLHLAATLGLAAVVYDVMVYEHADVNEIAGSGPRASTPLNSAIEQGNLEVMKVLLDLGAKIEELNFAFAMRHKSNADVMITLLLDKLDERGSDIKITEQTLRYAGEDMECGAAILALLLNRRGDEVKITEAVVKGIAREGSIETMSLLLDERGDEFRITEDVMKSVTNNTRDMFALLLKRRSQEVKVTEAVLMKAAYYAQHLQTFDLLLDHSCGIKITAEILKQAISNIYKGSEITALLLDKRGHEFVITEEIVKAAVSNIFNGAKITALLLDRRGHEFVITEEIVKAAVSEGSETTALLLNRRGHEFIITEEIVKAAVSNQSNGLEITALLLDTRGHEFVITEEIVKAAVSNIFDGAKITALLLDRRGHEFVITEEIVKAAVSEGSETTALLLDRRGHEFIITEEIVKAAVSNESNGLEITALLLDKRGHEFVITEEIVKAAVSNGRRGLKITALLLDRRGYEFKITEDISEAAARNWGDDHLRIISLLLDRRGHEFKITEEILKAAAGSFSDDILQTVSLLLDRCGDDLRITDDIFEVAVSNRVHGTKIATILLDKRGDEINITEDIFKAAVENDFDGWKLVTLLLDRRGNEISITEEIVIALLQRMLATESERNEFLALLQQAGERDDIERETKENDRIDRIRQRLRRFRRWIIRWIS